jgi:pentapeptide repeat protein
MYLSNSLRARPTSCETWSASHTVERTAGSTPGLYLLVRRTIQGASPSVFLILAGALLGIFIPIASTIAGEGTVLDCTGKFKGGMKPTPEELSIVLRDHARWLDTEEREGKQASLCEANLSKAELMGANLSKAKLMGANLSWANLMGANLSWVILTQANLSWADLSRANLMGAELSGAILTQANLSGAMLFSANLSEAELIWANLSGVSLQEADLRGATFDPRPGSLPLIENIALAKNLSQLTFSLSPSALAQVREEFKKRGLRRQERELTFAIMHTERVKAWKEGPAWAKFESAFNFLLFELPCLYGMAPGRLLRTLGLLIPLFSIPYMLALRGRGRSGIWAIPSAEAGSSTAKRLRLSLDPLLLGRPPGARHGSRLGRMVRTLRLSLYFSVLSAFNIGWRELNVGNWIQRLQSREYTLRATGWVRTVAGLQALLSVYLLALWVLTYFGRPFE